MSNWHKEWQTNFSNLEIPIGNRRADAIEGNIVLEFQHSFISKELVNNRFKNYLTHNKELYWIIDCNDMVCVYLKKDTVE